MSGKIKTSKENKRKPKEREDIDMLDSLSLLVIAFVAMSVVSVIGVVMMHLSKNKKLKKGLFYFLTIWGMLIAWCNVMMIPSYMTGELLLAWALGGLSAAALLMQLCMKKKNTFAIARWLVTASVVVGMVDAFMF